MPVENVDLTYESDMFRSAMIQYKAVNKTIQRKQDNLCSNLSKHKRNESAAMTACVVARRMPMVG